MIGNGLDRPIRNAAALANVERLEVEEWQSHSNESFIGNVTGAQR